MIDLRSDTVTRPTAGMRAAMARAEVGDDVFGDDPTVNALEERMATLFGHEAGLFCPSGTMANQIAIKVHTRPGDEVICDEGAHVYRHEGGGLMANSGCSVKLLQGDRGRFTAAQVLGAIGDRNDVHQAKSRLVCVENTSNRGGGSIWDLAEVQQIKEACTAHQLALHMDGARIFNALAVTGESFHDWGRPMDSISICLSKGLGAPVGSVLVGTRAFITEARHVRKRFGGGMRQAGILAAAGVYALDHHAGRLQEDHVRARHIGAALAELPCVESVVPVVTNIVIANLRAPMEASGFLLKLREQGVLASRFGPQTIRFVTHLDIHDADLECTRAALHALAP